MGGTEKTEGETDFKKGGQSGSRVWCLKKWAGAPSRTMQRFSRLHKLYRLLYVVHTSCLAAFKGDIQNFREEERTLHEVT